MCKARGLLFRIQELDVEIGSTAVELDSRRCVVRRRESAIANLFADAMRAATGADVALTNGGGIRADKGYPPGTRKPPSRLRPAGTARQCLCAKANPARQAAISTTSAGEIALIRSIDPLTGISQSPILTLA